MSVEKLAPDFKSSALENSGFIGAPTVEAPAMFKRAPSMLSVLAASLSLGLVAWQGVARCCRVAWRGVMWFGAQG